MVDDVQAQEGGADLVRDRPSAGTTAVDVGIFAHNEEKRIGALIRDLFAQSAFDNPDLDIRVSVLANGCSDGTVEVVRGALAELPPERAGRVTLFDRSQAGKSRTWNFFVSEVARAEADILVMVDGDIRLPDAGTVGRLIDGLRTRRDLRVFTSRPVKDLAVDRGSKGLVERAIVAGAGDLTDWRRSLCGQLYAIRAEVARKIRLPIGLPVEDGFVRAMSVTDFLTDLGHDGARIDGDPSVWHQYASIRTIPELVRHQTRIVVGSAINAALYARMSRLAPTPEAAQSMLHEAAGDDEWLARVLREELPRAPFGYVPFRFLVKRVRRADLPALIRRPQKLAAFLCGVGLDTVSYVLATFRMMSGRAAGHW